MRNIVRLDLIFFCQLALSGGYRNYRNQDKFPRACVRHLLTDLFVMLHLLLLFYSCITHISLLFYSSLLLYLAPAVMIHHGHPSSSIIILSHHDVNHHCNPHLPLVAPRSGSGGSEERLSGLLPPSLMVIVLCQGLS